MIIDFAPLEGITNYSYRQKHAKYFPGIDHYYTPFLTVNQNFKFKNKEKKEVDPLLNQHIQLVPQLLANKSDQLLWGMNLLADLGYDEVNLNVGCPAKTVVTKNKGSGLLNHLDLLDQLLSDVFKENPSIQLSVKTRIGVDDADHLKEIIEIYNRYPLSQVIIHPRIQKQMYKGQPDYEAFNYALTHCHHPVVYNGNIFTVEDYQKICTLFPAVDHIMIGRGLIANPGLVQEIKTGQRITIQQLKQFHDDLLEEYIRNIHSDKNVLFKMKELWFYMGTLFNAPKALKAIRKSQTIKQYRLAVEKLWDEDILPDDQRVITI